MNKQLLQAKVLAVVKARAVVIISTLASLRLNLQVPGQQRNSSLLTVCLCLFMTISPSFSKAAEAGEVAHEPLSITSLVATPEEDHLRSLSVLGYAKINKDDLMYIYSSKEQAEVEDVNSSVFIGWLPNFSDQAALKMCNNKYIIVSGIYVYDSEARTKVIEPIHGITNVSVNAIAGREVCYKGDAPIL